MTDYLNFALLGVGNGAVFAALAVALVVMLPQLRRRQLRHRRARAARRVHVRVPAPRRTAHPAAAAAEHASTSAGPSPSAARWSSPSLIEAAGRRRRCTSIVFRPLRRATPARQSGRLARCDGLVADRH